MEGSGVGGGVVAEEEEGSSSDKVVAAVVRGTCSMVSFGCDTLEN